MKKELDESLCRDFPSIFRDRNKPMEETCMYWGLDVGDGWERLVRNVCLYIDNALRNAKSSAIWEYNKAHNLEYGAALSPEAVKELKIDEMAVVADQVKEKFGTLRFNWHGENLPDGTYDEVSGAVRMAEMLSGETCERCGMPGELRGPGWLSTECNGCADGKTTMREYNAWVDKRESLELTGEAWATREKGT